jgi:hypothetical protein
MPPIIKDRFLITKIKILQFLRMAKMDHRATTSILIHSLINSKEASHMITKEDYSNNNKIDKLSSRIFFR